MALKKVCSRSGCNELIDMGVRWCDKHKDSDKERQRAYDLHIRNKEHDKFYHSPEWKMLREVVKAKFNGLCTRCLDNKLFKAGVIADHRIPLSVDWSLRLVEDNIDFLCRECHNTKSSEDKRKYGFY